MQTLQVEAGLDETVAALASSTRRAILGRLARFHAGSGIVSLAGNVGITVALVEWLHMPAAVANTCAVGVLSALNFRLADGWVFSGRPNCTST